MNRSLQSEKLILIGPKTGIKGGGNVSFNHLLDELDRREVEYTCIDMPGGNYSLMRAFLLLKYVYLFARTIGRGSTISLHASDNSAMVYAFILDLFARKTGSKLFIRIFGGQHLDHLQKQNRILKNKLIECYSRNTLMLQTKSMVRRAEEEFEIEGVVWFPTSRPETEPKTAGSFNMDGKLKLLYIGQVRETKGVDHIILLAKMIKAQNLNIEIQLFGELFEERFDKEITALPESIIQYGGVLQSDRVYDEMRSADMLIFPTEYEGEGYPGRERKQQLPERARLRSRQRGVVLRRRGWHPQDDERGRRARHRSLRRHYRWSRHRGCGVLERRGRVSVHPQRHQQAHGRRYQRW